MALATWLQFAHVLLAILASGTSAGLSLWVLRARGRPQESYILREAAWVAERVVAPPLALTGVLGIATARAFGAAWTTMAWGRDSALLLLFALAGIFATTPLLRRRAARLEKGETIARIDWPAELIGGAAGLAIVAIVYLMVVQPI
ncbi:MAG: hypothetical protein ACYDDF_11665 [Thermoplasmatota archaeon]